MDGMNLNKLWYITEELAHLSRDNTDRHYLYWADLEWFNKCQDIQNKINLPINKKTFMDVRKDLYSNEAFLSVDINSLDIPYLWINGFHDFIMNGTDGAFTKTENFITFYQSAHYPHIEESKHFSEQINSFITNLTRHLD